MLTKGDWIIIGIVGILIWVAFMCIPSGAVTPTLMDNEQLIIGGHIYEPYNGTVVTVTNVRTGESLIVEPRFYDDFSILEYEYLEWQDTLGNLKMEWYTGDIINVSYGNQTVSVIANESHYFVQIDFNRPEGINPVPLIAGSTLILSACGTYYYALKRRVKKESEEVVIESISIYTWICNVVEKNWIIVGILLYLFLITLCCIVVY